MYIYPKVPPTISLPPAPARVEPPIDPLGARQRERSREAQRREAETRETLLAQAMIREGERLDQIGSVRRVIQHQSDIVKGMGQGEQGASALRARQAELAKGRERVRETSKTK